jgi:hypothetical protein
MLTATGPAGTRWFTHDDRGLIERHPERDPKLPLAARLPELGDYQVLSYRPGRRMVVLVGHGAHRTVLKGHKRGRSARAATFQGYAEGAMHRGAWRVPRLLSHDGASETLVFEHVAAREVELRGESALLYEELGRRLSVFQGEETSVSLGRFRVRDELEVLERWQGKVLQALGALPLGWSEARRRLEECSAQLPPPRLGLCHRDLHDRQVHANGAEVVLFDFDLLCCADVALDAGNLSAHLRWRGVQGLHGADSTGVRELETAFLRGLARDGEDGFAARHAFYTASALLRLALVYGLRPRWSAHVAELVARAGAVLDHLATLR